MHNKKNTIIGSNNVVASNTVLSRKYEKQNTIIAGNPARIVKEGVIWKSNQPLKKKT